MSQSALSKSFKRPSAKSPEKKTPEPKRLLKSSSKRVELGTVEKPLKKPVNQKLQSAKSEKSLVPVKKETEVKPFNLRERKVVKYLVEIEINEEE